MRSGCTPAIKSGNLSYSVSLPRNVLEIGYELCDAVDEGQARIFVVFHADKCHPHVYIYYIAGGRTGSERLDRPDPGLHHIHLEELDRPTLLKLVQKNVVSKKYKVDGKTHRDI